MTTNWLGHPNFSGSWASIHKKAQFPDGVTTGLPLRPTKRAVPMGIEPTEVDVADLTGRRGSLAASLEVSQTARGTTTDSATPIRNIEEFPPEIRRMIISHLDFAGLSTLIQASPVFLQQFLPEKNVALWQCLKNSLGLCAEGAILDELATGLEFDLLMKAANARSNRDKVGGEDQVAYSVETPQDIGIEPLLHDAPTTLLVRIARIHRLVVEPLISFMNEWVSTYRTPGRGLSASDKERLARATYRFYFVVGGFSPKTVSSRRSLWIRFSDGSAAESSRFRFGADPQPARPTISLFYELMESISKSVLMTFAHAHNTKSPKRIAQSHPVLRDKYLILAYITIRQTPTRTFLRQILLDKGFESFFTILSLLAEPSRPQSQYGSIGLDSSVHLEARQRALRDLPGSTVATLFSDDDPGRRHDGGDDQGQVTLNNDWRDSFYASGSFMVGVVGVGWIKAVAHLPDEAT
ncbi:hypothetical protein QBC43DRAFT_329630 [Cladorrhinum sp. PSN259]|nr:hypothetical protein QBC43DRAFT_329630 [Cladorrhinum sp. PSN259]